MVKRHQEQGTGPSPSAAIHAPPEEDNDDTKVTGADLSGTGAGTTQGVTGRAGGREDTSKGVAKGDKGEDAGEAPPIRSLISSIRCVRLFAVSHPLCASFWARGPP